jgi:hypothetical protein
MLYKPATYYSLNGGDNVAYHMFYDKQPKKYIRRLFKASLIKPVYNNVEDEYYEDDYKCDMCDKWDYDTLADVM